MNQYLSRYFSFGRVSLSSGLRALAMVMAVLVTGSHELSAQTNVPYEVVGDFKDWAVATYKDEEGRRVCFMVSRPKSSKGDYTRRGAVYVQVTRRAGGPVSDVVSFEYGYDFPADAEAEITIDGEKFVLYTFNETAWADGEDDDRALVAAMRKGRKMVARGRSARGTDTQDSYSLLGFTAAHKASVEACR